MERHQPENLVVTNWGGSDGSDSDGDSDNGDDANDGGAGGRSSRKGTGGGGGGGCSGGTGAGGGKVAVTREEVISNLVELFKEVRDLTVFLAFLCTVETCRGVYSLKSGVSWTTAVHRSTARPGSETYT